MWNKVLFVSCCTLFYCVIESMLIAVCDTSRACRGLDHQPGDVRLPDAPRTVRIYQQAGGTGVGGGEIG